MLSSKETIVPGVVNIFQATPLRMEDILLVALILAGLVVIGFLVPVILGKNRGDRKTTKQESGLQKADQIQRNRLQALFEIILRMSNTLVYEKVIDLALDVSGAALGVNEDSAKRLVSCVLIFFDEGEGKMRLKVASSRRMTPSDQRVELPGGAGALAQAVNSAEPVLIRDIPKDPELANFVGLRSCRSAFCLPLRTGLDAYGVMVFAHPDLNFFGASQRDVLEILAHQAIVAIQNALLYKKLETEKERQLQIHEDARKKLARDLHDGPAQSVAAIAMRINFTRRLIDKSVDGAKKELVVIENLARRTSKEVRHMLFTLRPLVLESEGLEAALQVMSDKMRETYDQNVLIEVNHEVVPKLEAGRQTIMFYIAEEAVNNARKHAQAAHIWVRIWQQSPEVAVLEIKDDGVGFSTGSVDAGYNRRGSLGMVNMRERTELVNGVLRIQSAEGQGTMIQVLIPLTEDAEERLRRGG